MFDLKQSVSFQPSDYFQYIEMGSIIFIIIILVIFLFVNGSTLNGGEYFAVILAMAVGVIGIGASWYTNKVMTV
jgi:hypothetical protein